MAAAAWSFAAGAVSWPSVREPVLQLFNVNPSEPKDRVLVSYKFGPDFKVYVLAVHSEPGGLTIDGVESEMIID